MNQQLIRDEGPPNRINWAELKNERQSAWRSIIDFAAVCAAREADELSRVVNDVYHAPIAYSDAPMILVALQLLAPRRPWVVRERQNPTIYPNEQHLL